MYYSTIQISFSDLKKEIGSHLVISIFHFQFENENQKIGSIFRFSFIMWNFISLQTKSEPKMKQVGALNLQASQTLEIFEELSVN